MDYGKPIQLPVDELIAELKAWGLTIGDKERAARYLSFVGYYRLSFLFEGIQSDIFRKCINNMYYIK